MPPLPLLRDEEVIEAQPDQAALYELIWKRFVASQMAQAVVILF